MSVQLIPDWRIISTEMMIKVIQESNENNKRFCFILSLGVSIESGIASGIELEKRWMDYLMGEAKNEKNSLGDPKVVREYAKKLKDDGVIQFDFSQIENDWKNDKLSSEYYFDLYTLRFYPDYNNGYRYLEKQMESAEPSLGYRILAKLLTDKNRNNLVITTNFDSLTEDALFLYTDKKPLVVNHELLADYISVPSIDRPIVAKIHRGLFFNPLNSRDDTNKLSKEWREALSSVFQIFTPIVIGYGGGDHSLMDFLKDESVKMRNKIYWCYIPKYGLPNKTIQKLINDKDGFLVEINGFDSFMADIGSKFYSTEITPPETANILQQRCNSRINQYTERWRDLHSDSKSVKDLKSLELALEMKREKSNALTYFDYFRRGTECAENKQLENAIEYFDKSIELNCNFALTYYNRGVAYAYLNQYDKAIEDYNKAIELNPNYSDAYNNRGNSYADLKQYDKAIEDYNKAIKLNPNDSGFYCNRGNSYAHLKQNGKATEDYNKAIELNPNDSGFYCNRGNSYADLKQYDKAIEDYNKAIELNSNYSMAYNNRGNLYANLKQYDKAIENFNNAIELNPNYSRAYYNRGNSYADLKQYDKAIEDYNKAIELNPNNLESYCNRGASYADLKQYDKAIEDYSKAIELNPNNSNAYNNRGISYKYLKQYDKAIEDYSKAIELNPNDPKTYNNRGNLYADLKRYDKAIEDCNKAIELDSDNLIAYNNRGDAYTALEQYDKAIEDYSKAIELDSELKEAYIGRAKVYRLLNKPELAKPDEDKVKELDKKDEDK